MNANEFRIEKGVVPAAVECRVDACVRPHAASYRGRLPGNGAGCISVQILRAGAAGKAESNSSCVGGMAEEGCLTETHRQAAIEFRTDN